MFGSTEIIIIVLIVFLLFGAKSLPKFAKSIGEARKELQKVWMIQNLKITKHPTQPLLNQQRHQKTTNHPVQIRNNQNRTIKTIHQTPKSSIL